LSSSNIVWDFLPNSRNQTNFYAPCIQALECHASKCWTMWQIKQVFCVFHPPPHYQPIVFHWFLTLACISNFIFGMYIIFTYVLVPFLHPFQNFFCLFTTNMFLERIPFKYKMFIFLFNLRVDVTLDNLHTTVTTYYNLAQGSFGTHSIWNFLVDS